MKAQSVGCCARCGEDYARDTDISKWGDEWMHADCAEFERNKASILSGETFRSWKPPTWSLKPNRSESNRSRESVVVS